VVCSAAGPAGALAVWVVASGEPVRSDLDGPPTAPRLSVDAGAGARFCGSRGACEGHLGMARRRAGPAL